MSDERNRAWRRFKNRVNRGNGMGAEDRWKPEKNCKMLYLRSEKLVRAKQLGFEYPRMNARKIIDIEFTEDE